MTRELTDRNWGGSRHATFRPKPTDRLSGGPRPRDDAGTGESGWNADFGLLASSDW